MCWLTHGKGIEPMPTNTLLLRFAALMEQAKVTRKWTFAFEGKLYRLEQDRDRPDQDWVVLVE